MLEAGFYWVRVGEELFVAENLGHGGWHVPGDENLWFAKEFTAIGPKIAAPVPF